MGVLSMAHIPVHPKVTFVTACDTPVPTPLLIPTCLWSHSWAVLKDWTQLPSCSMDRRGEAGRGAGRAGNAEMERHSEERAGEHW